MYYAHTQLYYQYCTLGEISGRLFASFSGASGPKLGSLRPLFRGTNVLYL